MLLIKKLLNVCALFGFMVGTALFAMDHQESRFNALAPETTLQIFRAASQRTPDEIQKDQQDDMPLHHELPSRKVLGSLVLVNSYFSQFFYPNENNSPLLQKELLRWDAMVALEKKMCVKRGVEPSNENRTLIFTSSVSMDCEGLRKFDQPLYSYLLEIFKHKHSNCSFLYLKSQSKYPLNISLLPSFTELHDLYLHVMIDNASPLKEMTQLQTLDFTCSAKVNLNDLTLLTNLQRLCIRVCTPNMMPSFDPLSTLTQIKKLSLSDALYNKVTDILSTHTHLDNLPLNYLTIDPSTIEGLTKLSSLMLDTTLSYNHLYFKEGQQIKD